MSNVSPATPEQAPRRIWDNQLAVRLVASAAIGSTFVYLTWRLLTTRVGAPMWLFAPVFVLELWGLFRLLVDTRVLWTVPPTKRLELTEVPKVDVVVTTFHEPVHVVRATLIGANAIAVPHGTVLVDDSGRDEMRQLAAEFGVRYEHRGSTEHARAGALNHALATSEADYLLLLDADQVPLPDALHAIGELVLDHRVAIVQTPIEYLNRDSILHSSPDRHERSYANDVISPARDHLGGAVWEGSASLVRRIAIMSIGGIATDATTGELQTSTRLHANGWIIRYHAEPIVQGLAPHNLPAFLRQRERWARGQIGVIGTDDDPLRVPGLFREQRWSFGHLLSEYLQAPVDLAWFVVLLSVLVTGHIPFTASIVALAAFWLPAFALRSIAHVALSRGRLQIGEAAARRLLMMEIHLRAIVGRFTQGKGRFAPVEKTGVDEGGLDVIEHLKLLTAMTLTLEIVLGLRMLDALIGRPLPSMRGLALIAAAAVGAAVLWMALQVLGVFVRRRQHRSHYRVGVDLGGYLDGALVKIRDLTPAGAGVITTKRLEPGARVHVRIRLPDARGGAATLDLQAVVRNITPNQHGTRYRTGCSFIGLTPAQVNLITEYSSVVRPYQLLRRPSLTSAATTSRA